MADETITSRRFTRLRTFRAGLLFALAITHVAVGQGPEPKFEFVQAVGQFGLAQDGSFGDEGSRIRVSLDAMQTSLTRWDATIRAYESGMAADLRTADPLLTTRMRVALAGVYLDRGRTADAFRELAAARQLYPAHADAVTFEALTHSQVTGDDASAVAALRRAASLKPDDAVTEYCLGDNYNGRAPARKPSKRLLDSG